MKFDIGCKDRTFHFEADVDLSGLKIGDKVKGEDINLKFSSYEFEITGLSDTSGFPSRKEIEGIARKRILLKKGIGMREKGKGLIRRKSIRGNTISMDIAQINLKTIKEGKEPLSKILGKEEKAEEKKE